MGWAGQATPSATGLPLMLSSQAGYVIVSGFRAALDLDTYPLSNLIRPPCAERAKRGRGKPVHIGLCSSLSTSVQESFDRPTSSDERRPHPHPCGSDIALTEQLTTIQQLGIAPSTHRTYQAEIKHSYNKQQTLRPPSGTAPMPITVSPNPPSLCT